MDISATAIIDEAIRRLEKLKDDGTDPNKAVESLYIVRAYCGLLLNAYREEGRFSRSNNRLISHKVPNNNDVPDDDANGESLLDF